MSKTAITVKNISKIYRLGVKEELSDSLVGKILSILKSPIRNYIRLNKQSHFNNDEDKSDTLWALKDISFEVNYGEVLGIIGANGAGKSTLLKILSQITEPTSGQIKINGRVASLLEVGTGFHPDLTGRENIYLNGTILGMSKQEIDKKFDEIIDFSGISKFIDTPVKRYSSGMGVRLAFSVAAFLEPEILLIDEVLAVGDAEFQKKCLGKMEDVVSSGRTILFVSHNMQAIKELCHKCILMKNGKIEDIDETNKIINNYLNPAKKNFFSTVKIGDYKIQFLKNSPVDVIDIFMIDNKNSSDRQHLFSMSDDIQIQIDIKAFDSIKNALIGLSIYNEDGIKCFDVCSSDKNYFLNCHSSGSYSIIFRVNQIQLTPGNYSIGLGINQNEQSKAWIIIRYLPLFKIDNDKIQGSNQARVWGIVNPIDSVWSNVKKLES